MTIICWDGKTLAADKMASFGGQHGTTIKLHRIDGMLIGGCGTTALIKQMVSWFRDGCDVDSFPAQQRDAKECASILMVNGDGFIYQYENTPFPIQLQDKFWAIGSGRDFAMTALYLGKTAEEAVGITCVLCSDCGNGIDTMTLEPKCPAKAHQS